MLTKRPLLDTAADQELFVADESRQRAIEAAFKHRNTLVVGEPGSGKTSLLYQIRGNANRTSELPRAVLVDARLAGDAYELVDLLARECADAGWLEEVARPDRDDPFGLVSQIRRLRDAPEGSMILIDDPDTEQAATLFGRLRDELWQLGVWFVVAVNVGIYGALKQPPANAFFDTVVRLEPLDPKAAVDMLRRREHRGELEEVNRPPSSAMQPRAVLLDAEAGPSSARHDGELQGKLLTVAEQAAGRSGAALLQEIWNRGAVSASDAGLQRSLGVTRTRLTQLLKELERAGTLVASSQPGAGTIGRPRTLYDLNRNV